MDNAAASPFRGSDAFGYSRSCGRNTVKMLTRSNMGDHVWLMTSRHIDPLCSHTFGWNILFTNPMLGDLYGYDSGSSTCTRQMPPSYADSLGP